MKTSLVRTIAQEPAGQLQENDTSLSVLTTVRNMLPLALWINRSASQEYPDGQTSTVRDVTAGLHVLSKASFAASSANLRHSIANKLQKSRG